jgi:hypothetical protein
MSHSNPESRELPAWAEITIFAAALFALMWLSMWLAATHSR